MGHSGDGLMDTDIFLDLNPASPSQAFLAPTGRHGLVVLITHGWVVCPTKTFGELVAGVGNHNLNSVSRVGLNRADRIILFGRSRPKRWVDGEVAVYQLRGALESALRSSCEHSGPCRL